MAPISPPSALMFEKHHNHNAAAVMGAAPFDCACLLRGSSISSPSSKRRKTERVVYSAHSFGPGGTAAIPAGPFRENIHAFLEAHAEADRYGLGGLPTWSILLEDEAGLRFSLLIVEEETQEPAQSHCDQCRCIGWSHHPVSKQRYHFLVLPRDCEEAGAALGKGRKKCSSCSETIPASVKQCACCGADSVRSWGLASPSHLLHGVIHTNGFGHLLKISGQDSSKMCGGGKLLECGQLMTLWDNLCCLLCARLVSVEDVATDGNMELRLLHNVAFGASSYARWGYGFGHGSFGITEKSFLQAVNVLRSLPLHVLAQHFEGVDAEVASIVLFYRAHSQGRLASLGDLARYLLELRASLPRRNISRQSSFSRGGSSSPRTTLVAPSTPRIIREPFPSDHPSCRWSAKRLELAQEVIVDALKQRAGECVPRHEVREAARQKIGDTGLLDYVLKSLGNRLVCGFVVRRSVNEATKVLEFSLEEVAEGDIEQYDAVPNSPGSSSDGPPVATKKEPAEVAQLLTRDDVERDLALIYKQCVASYRPAVSQPHVQLVAELQNASRIILDTKQLIKNYGNDEQKLRGLRSRESAHRDDENFRVVCSVILEDEDRVRNRASPPPELVVLPPHATVWDLKQAATRAFQETYHIMHSFQVEKIVGLDADDDDLLFGAIEASSFFTVEGSGLDFLSEWRYEGGNDSWVVDCPCGAKDDDGERMISCDTCETWQHTRCCGIADAKVVPQHFLCSVCSQAAEGSSILGSW